MFIHISFLRGPPTVRQPHVYSIVGGRGSELYLKGNPQLKTQTNATVCLAQYEQSNVLLVLTPLVQAIKTAVRNLLILIPYGTAFVYTALMNYIMRVAARRQRAAAVGRHSFIFQIWAPCRGDVCGRERTGLPLRARSKVFLVPTLQHDPRPATVYSLVGGRGSESFI